MGLNTILNPEELQMKWKYNNKLGTLQMQNGDLEVVEIKVVTARGGGNSDLPKGADG